MKILHTLYSVGPKSFGLGPVALNLCREQNNLGQTAEIWCVDNRDDRDWATENSGFPSSLLSGFSTVGPRKLYFSPAMEKAAIARGGEYSIVHQHALWTGLSRITNQLREEKEIPTIVTPHGMLESWALKKSSLKKRIALSVYEKKNLCNASCLYACSEQEMEGFRKFGLTNPVAVIPNGISSDWLSSQGNQDSFRESFGIPPEKRIMLFLSRITPVKNLLMFLDAIKLVQDLMKDWVFVIAGADEFNHKAEVEKKIETLRFNDSIVFTGMLLNQAKRDAFAAAELFVLPTKREAAPIVVLEALGAGVPVLTTTGTPWEQLKTSGCGWYVDVSAESMAEGLDRALQTSSDTLMLMGQKGKELVAKTYTWEEAAKKTIHLYKWLLHQEDRPSFVMLNEFGGGL